MFLSGKFHGEGFPSGDRPASLVLVFCCVLCLSLVQPNLSARSLSPRQWYQQGQEAQAAADWYTAVECYQEADAVSPRLGPSMDLELGGRPISHEWCGNSTHKHSLLSSRTPNSA